MEGKGRLPQRRAMGTTPVCGHERAGQQQCQHHPVCLVAALVCMRSSRARPGEIQARLLGCLPSSPCVPETPSADGYPWAEGCADGRQGPPVSEEGYGNCTCVWPRTSWATAMPASSCMQSQLSKVPNGTSSEQDEQQTVKRQRTSLERRPKERPRASLVAALVCMWLSRARPGEIQARLLGCLPSSPCVPGSPLSNGYPWAEGCADGGQGPPVSEEGYGNCTCVWPRTSWATAMPASSCMESQPSNLPNGMSSER
ncbi:uncharacterized protein AAGF69_008523 isoform 7-T9 [Amazona ochrocephala]